MQVRTIAFYNRPFPCGGAETVTRNLAYFFHARGMRVLIYTSLLQVDLLSKEDRQTFETRYFRTRPMKPGRGTWSFSRNPWSRNRSMC